MSLASHQCSDRYIIWLREESSDKSKVNELSGCLSDIINKVLDTYHDEKLIITVTTPPELVCQNIIKPDLENLIRLFKEKGKKVTILFLVGGEECRLEGVKDELGLMDENAIEGMRRENPIYYNPFDIVFENNTLRQILKDLELTLETQSYWQRELGVDVVAIHDKVLKTIKTNKIEGVTKLLWGRNTSAVRRLAAATSLLRHYKIVYFDTVLSTFIKANLLSEDIGNVEKLFEVIGNNVIAIMGRDPPREPKTVINFMRELATDAGKNYEFITTEKKEEDEVRKSIRCIKNLHWALCLGTIYILEKFIIGLIEEKKDKEKFEIIKSLIEKLTKNPALAYVFPIHIFSKIDKNCNERKFSSKWWKGVSDRYCKHILDTLLKEYFDDYEIKSFIDIIPYSRTEFDYYKYEDVLRNTFIRDGYYRVYQTNAIFYTQLLQFISGFKELDTVDIVGIPVESSEEGKGDEKKRKWNGGWVSPGGKKVNSLAEVRICIDYFASIDNKKDKDEKVEEIRQYVRLFKNYTTSDKNSIVTECGEKCAKALQHMEKFIETSI